MRMRHHFRGAGRQWLDRRPSRSGRAAAATLTTDMPASAEIGREGCGRAPRNRRMRPAPRRANPCPSDVLQIALDLPFAGRVERQIMGQQPAARVERVPFRFAQPIVFDRTASDRAERSCCRRRCQRPAERGPAEHDRAVLAEAGGRHELGEPFRIPQRSWRGEVRIHQWWAYSWKKVAWSLERRLAGVARPLRHDRDRAFRAGPIEAGEVGRHVVAGAGQPLDVLDVGHDEHRQAIAVADLGIGHAAHLAHRLVEFLQPGGEGAQLVGRFIGIDDEMRAAGLVPGGIGRRGGERRKQGAAQQSDTQVGTLP